MSGLKVTVSRTESEFLGLSDLLILLSKRTDIIQSNLRAQRKVTQLNKEKIQNIGDRVAEQEDYTHRSNLRLIFLPEGEEGSDTIGFLQRQLHIWLPTLLFKISESYGVLLLDKGGGDKDVHGDSQMVGDDEFRGGQVEMEMPEVQTRSSVCSFLWVGKPTYWVMLKKFRESRSSVEVLQSVESMCMLNHQVAEQMERWCRVV